MVNGRASTSLVVNLVVWGVCRRGLNPQRQWEDSQGKAMVANRTGEIPPSGMTRGAYGNVGYGWGYTGTYRGNAETDKP